MRIARLFPPLGWLVSIAVSALVTVPWQGGELPPVAEFAFVPGETGSPVTSASLSLPDPADPNAALMAFTERPLLAEGRRAFVPEPREAEPVVQPIVPALLPMADDTPEPPALVMLGSIKKSDGWQVLLREEAGGLEAWVGIGATYAGWTIIDVQPDSVTLQLQDAEITLHMFQNTLP